ncbi:hypothetical protein [Kribbella sp. CA-294648]|uniref:hypothetical protein n=1 Tax=Kribbella sp. CA-294648 TaxID=3239948 RepID=UPI003D92B8BD
MRCDQNHAWWRYHPADSELAGIDLICPVDGTEAVTAGKLALADRVVLKLIPVAWDREGTIGFDDEHFIEISRRDGARSLRSARVFSFDEACRRLSWFKGLTWADAERRWERTGMRTPDALKMDSSAHEGG